MEKLIQDKADDAIIKVNRMYADTFNELQQQIRKIFEKFTLDAGISASDAIKLLNREQTKDMRDMLLRMYRNTDDAKLKQELLNSLKAPAYAYRISRAEALKDLIYYEAHMCGYNTEKILTNRLINTYKESYYRTTYNTQVGTCLHYNFNKLSNPAVRAAISQDWKGSNYSKRIWKNTDKLAESLERIIKSGILSGQSQRKMVAAIKQEMDSSTYMADRLIRTEVSYICGQGRLLSYKRAGIKRYIYIATLDLRTSEICRSLDHKIFSVEDAEVGKNFPPMHPNCRSVDGAYIDGKDVSNLKRGARDPATGKTMIVPYNMTYKEWYDTYVKGDEEAKDKLGLITNNNKGSSRYYDYKDKDIETVEKEISQFKYEVAVGFNEEGKAVFAQLGDADSVKFTKYQMLKMKGLDVTHNHPYSTPPSPEDLYNIVVNGKTKSFRTCGKNGSYVLKYGQYINELPSYEEFDKEYNSLTENNLKKYLDMVDNKIITLEKAEILLQEETWEILKDKYNIDYTFERR